MNVAIPGGAIPAGPPVQVGKALLLLDLNNDFVSADGKLFVPSASAFLHRISPLARAFRSQGTVIWARSEYIQQRQPYAPEVGSNTILLKQSQPNAADDSAPPYRQRRSNSQQSAAQTDPEAFLGRQDYAEENRPCIRDTTGFQYPEVITQAIDPARDISVAKSHYSAFSDSSLLLSLRMRLITHVYIAGSLSNISVYATVLDAVRHGMQVTLIEDCLGYITESCHVAAVRQMVDEMGASGIDHQELMDDLAGLLGDVIHEEDFSTRYEVSMTSIPISVPTAPPGQSLSQIQGQRSPPQKKHQSVEEWRAKLWGEDQELTDINLEGERTLQKAKRDSPSTIDESSRAHKSAKVSSREGTPGLSPQRKRSISDREDLVDEVVAKSLRKSIERPTPSHTQSAEGTRLRSNRTRVRRPPTSAARLRSPTHLTSTCTQSTGDLPNPDATPLPLVDMNSPLMSTPSPQQPHPSPLPPSRKIKKLKSTAPVLVPNDLIGTGDSSLHLNIMFPDQADTHFQALRQNVKWQKMYHRTGEVPRLVAVQGAITPDGDIPIYRHPADESPALLPFDETVLALKSEAENIVGHELNHVLIQWYRSGEDSISEHSDKTLDIVRGSSIVNFSLGAKRTMTLRTKRPENQAGGEDTKRLMQRIHLPHNSVFVLGEETNRFWLHAIRADKRPVQERDEEEMASDGERISLTFRNIGTWINEEDGTIWGQGATGKERSESKKLLVGKKAEEKGEEMIVGFGKENHLSASWDWEEVYGQGWDAVNFAVKEIGKKKDEKGEKGEKDEEANTEEVEKAEEEKTLQQLVPQKKEELVENGVT